MAEGTYANIQPNPFVSFMKKIWPVVYRIINSVFYFILSVIKSIFRGIMEQMKGGGG